MEAIVLFACFLAIFSGALMAIYRRSGWRKLAQSYASKEVFTGKIVSGVSACFRKGNYYNGILIIGKNDQHLYLSQLFLFNVFCDNLLIPIEHVHISKMPMLSLFSVKITITTQPDVFFRISSLTAKRLGLVVK